MNKLEEKPSENGSVAAGTEKKKTANGIGNNSRAPFAIKAKFEGDCDDLKGHIYDCNDSKKVNLLIKTNKKLSEYVGKKFKDFPGDMQALVRNLEMPSFFMPDDPAETETQTEIRIWEKKCDSYAKREEALEQNIQ